MLPTRRLGSKFLLRRALSTTVDQAAVLQSVQTPGGATKLYDDWAETYDETLTKWDYQAPAEVAALATTLMADRASILDCGCGTGLAGEALQREGFTEVSGVDISTASLEVSRSKGVYNSVQHGSLEEPLPFAADTFAGVVCVGVLSYITDLRALQSEWLRVTKPGGYIIFTHRQDLWDDDKLDVRSTAEGHEQAQAWSMEHQSEPRHYFEGYEHQIYYLAFRKALLPA